MERRDFFRKAGIGSATLVSLPVLAHALTIPAWARSPREPGEQPADTFVILLQEELLARNPAPSAPRELHGVPRVP